MKEKLSVVVIVYNLQREAPRTFYTLSALYQHDVSECDYEVLVIENGSDSPLSPAEVKSFGPNFSYFNMFDPKPSPTSAINYSVSLTLGKYGGILIDGARMLSPGILKNAFNGFRAFKNPVLKDPVLSWTPSRIIY